MGSTRSEVTHVKHRPATSCPLGTCCPFCYSCKAFTKREEDFIPEIAVMRKSGRLWSNWDNRKFVYVIRDGVFEVIVHSSVGDEVPFALYSRGTTLGLTELYIPAEPSSLYSTRTLLDGEVCCVPHHIARAAIEDNRHVSLSKILAYSSLNQSASSLLVTRILSQPRIYDKIITLFFALKSLTENTSFSGNFFKITHEEIAFICCSDRGSITRALKKLQEDGIVDLGYSSILIDFSKCTDYPAEDYSIESYYPDCEMATDHRPRRR